MIIPIEIINKILGYVSDLNASIIITQYHLQTNTEYYKINFNSELIWKIHSTLLMKIYYPIRSGDFSDKSYELYKWGIPHYEKYIRLASRRRD
jgi:hypothetical protein